MADEVTTHSGALAQPICEVCGLSFRRKRRGSNDSRRACSRACGFVLLGIEGAKKRALSNAAKHLALRIKSELSVCVGCGCSVRIGSKRCSDCNAQHNRSRALDAYYTRQAALVFSREARNCAECSVSFHPAHAAMKYCGNKCSRKASRRGAKLTRKARQIGVENEYVNPISVFDRDGWRCHICNRATPRALRGTCKPRAPELDHIIPLSLGGPHTYANTACSCRECNGRKGATVLGRPSLLALAA